MSSADNADRPQKADADVQDEEIKLDSNESILNDAVVQDIEDDFVSEAAPDTELSEPKPETESEPSTPEEPVVEPESKTEEPEKLAEDSDPQEPEDDEVDDIIAEETMGEDDDPIGIGKPTPAKKHDKPKSEINLFLKRIWHNKTARWGVIGGTVVVGMLLMLVPPSRYFILNTARIRSSVELRVIDTSTLQPLKNVTVTAANASAQTDSDGVAKLTGVKLGKTKLHIEKRAFAAQERTITVGWGSNPLGEYKVTPIGSQYTFFIRDGLSGKALPGAEAVSGDGNARADEDGKLVLALDTTDLEDDAQVEVKISASDYRTETINITVNNKENQSINMVPSRKHVFVSKRSGNYDVYSVDIDGKNERRIVGGSGYERDDISLIPHPTENYAAYVATRENTRNQSGYLLSTLYVLNTATGDLVRIDQSEQIQVAGWSKDGRLVYVKIASGASGTDPKRHRLMSFNNDDYADVKELASSNSFNDVQMVEDKVYYAPSNIFDEATPGMHVINPDGSEGQQILDKEVFAIIRTAYDTLHLSGGENVWYDYVIGSPLAAKTDPPGSQTNRMYQTSPDGAYSAWIDDRDGQGVLLLRSKDSGEEQVIVERGGLKMPMYWLNDTYLVYRVADGRETADYVLNIEGGESRKIIDTTDTSGISRWYYF